MGKKYDSIPSSLIPWIQKQEVFWVATAPLSEDGHVSVSPKGLRGTFHVEDDRRVWYEDLSGSGCETIAHIRENGRITFLFHALDGPPRIVRLFGRGHVYEFGTPEYDSYIPPHKRLPSSRAVIACDVDRVGTSCGWGVPHYTFTGHRKFMYDYFHNMENKELKYDAEKLGEENDKLYEYGMKQWWLTLNTHSIDGLPGIQTAYKTPIPVQSYIPDLIEAGIKILPSNAKSGSNGAVEEVGDIEVSEEEMKELRHDSDSGERKLFGLHSVERVLIRWRNLGEETKSIAVCAFLAGVVGSSLVRVLSRLAVDWIS